jgi:uncharacterized membrane protein YhdT
MNALFLGWFLMLTGTVAYLTNLVDGLTMLGKWMVKKFCYFTPCLYIAIKKRVGYSKYSRGNGVIFSGKVL